MKIIIIKKIPEGTTPQYLSCWLTDVMRVLDRILLLAADHIFYQNILGKNLVYNNDTNLWQ